MFSFNINKFPGFFKRNVNDPPTKLVREAFTTAVVRHSYIQEEGGVPIKLTIDNDDSNDIVYRTNPQDASDTLLAPANGKTTIDNIIDTGFIEIIPDVATGKGTLSADLVPPQVLEALGYIAKGSIEG